METGIGSTRVTSFLSCNLFGLFCFLFFARAQIRIKGPPPSMVIRRDSEKTPSTRRFGRATVLLDGTRETLCLHVFWCFRVYSGRRYT